MRRRGESECVVIRGGDEAMMMVWNGGWMKVVMMMVWNGGWMKVGVRGVGARMKIQVVMFRCGGGCFGCDGGDGEGLMVVMRGWVWWRWMRMTVVVFRCGGGCFGCDGGDGEGLMVVMCGWVWWRWMRMTVVGWWLDAVRMMV